jgi:hypothetical protein
MPELRSRLRQQRDCCAFCSLLGWMGQTAAQVEHIELQELGRQYTAVVDPPR